MGREKESVEREADLQVGGELMTNWGTRETASDRDDNRRTSQFGDEGVHFSKTKERKEGIRMKRNFCWKFLSPVTKLE